ncbi:glycosyltransferase family 2 protein [Aurantiacibacter rhizosphaerae]|uniref:Glycosyltransferase n=1 Tax=Aurantiacibacter rhizosphaerae TaxID=2691582 RepID=A0A844XBF0_9SPHN|nr:galactosyltransferase-related protein [Aurantiacibacter rhizosphaerae]MWV27109.1 glycosyltransferase [Aurantiacibacter rhizosphaerae]
MTISVCTLAHGRQAHLANLVRGLNHSTRPPGELVIAVMQESRYHLPATSFPVRQVVLGDSGICLAEARNAAAARARGDLLVFLDVDCIPAPRLIDDYAAASAFNDGVLMGEVGYLPMGATDGGIDYRRFEEVAVKHSERAGPPPGTVGRCGDYRCFWSLNFALTAKTFDEIGGFDPRYVGYGGEDTDFGRTLVTKNVPLWWARGAKAYHQYHKHHMPPVHHLDSVVQNAKVFAEKWGEPTMQHWLRAFRLMGLIEPDGQGGWIKLKEPEEADLALTRQQEDQPYASSALVLEKLEEQARLGTGASRDAEITFA